MYQITWVEFIDGTNKVFVNGVYWQEMGVSQAIETMLKCLTADTPLDHVK